MQEKVYISFFILCIILSQEILAKFLEEGVGKSSEFLLRQKRVIDRSLNGESPLRSGDLPYVVNLKKNNRIHCMATILSHHTVITAARCVENPNLRIYTVQSGSAYTFRGNVHTITQVKMHGHNPSRTSRFLTGIALIIVNPPFEYTANVTSIDLHSGLVLAGMTGIVSGWGTRAFAGQVETEYATRLRFIAVPVMDHRECRNIYRDHFQITDEDICTYHPQKLCGDSDTGAALVIDKNLVGVYIGKILDTGTECPIAPDVFVLLQHAHYGPWIMNNIVH